MTRILANIVVLSLFIAIAWLSLGPSGPASFSVNDLLAHGLAYGVLTLALVCLGRQAVVPAILIASAFGVGMEGLQTMLPERTGEVSDALANLTGAIPGGLLGYHLRRYARFQRPFARTAAALFLVSMAGACGALPKPGNIEPVFEGNSYQPQYADLDQADAWDAKKTVKEELCEPDPELASLLREYRVTRNLTARGPGRVGEGDLLKVEIVGDETFSGPVIVDRDGMIRLPYIRPVPARGRSERDIARTLSASLVQEGHYLGTAPRVAVLRMETAAAQVFVSGAVYDPGSVTLNLAGADMRDPGRQATPGDTAGGRVLSLALRGAFGVRPDADLRNILLIRDGKVQRLDLTKAMRGRRFTDPLLMPGDEIYVPTTHCFDRDLVRPSPITPPGIKVFMSNLTKPADANALSAVGKDAREVRYGTRLSQALVGMNCVGGTQVTNASRFAVLMTRNPVTGNSIVVDRSVETLVRNRNRDAIDPMLLPGDAIACYDSKAINTGEVVKGLAKVVQIIGMFGMGIGM